MDREQFVELLRNHRTRGASRGILAEFDRLTAEILRLQTELHCDCGRKLSTGRCKVCDNDE